VLMVISSVVSFQIFGQVPEYSIVSWSHSHDFNACTYMTCQMFD